ncbi:MAG: hypothetical protein QOD45_1643 [Pseudonocardiales bacterium]|nr:hypothetical protein [Pseudonocardiales bacterium]
MHAAELLGLVLVLLAAALLAVALRRRVLQRSGGTVDLALRLKPQARGGGWVLGVGRFVEDDLQWYRVFSLSPRPRRRMSRRDLRVVEQRRPRDGETFALSEDAVVMSCRTGTGPVELGMGPSAVTGFLAWLEARPPGATLPP